MKNRFAVVLLAVLTAVAPAAPAALAAGPAGPRAGGLWSAVSAKRLAERPEIEVAPGSYSAHRLDAGALEALLAYAPSELARADRASLPVILLPMPDGSYQRFAFEASPVMEPALAAMFPEIRTFSAQGIDDPTATVRFDVTPAGFHAQIIRAGGTVYVDPYRRGETGLYVSYDKRGYRGAKRMECLVPNEGDFGPALDKAGVSAVRRGGTLRTYRLACAATGEYTAFHGGTVSAGMAAITTTVNRVDGVYERELSVRMILVANNNLVVYTNASTDPYSNTNGSAMLGQNQTTMTNVIGAANYDIGHVFSTGGGGVAYLRSVCNASNKAGGVTGGPSPVGDAFDIDYVAHEMGHQFGANHTFNDCGSQRNASTAYEPGSGTTIMAYAGICGATDVAAHSDDYFHGVSLDEIYAHIEGAGGCGVNTSVSTTAPTAAAGADFTIPVGTPFRLTGSGSDAEDAGLTYCWEEWDLGSVTSSTKPLFRSVTGTASPTRTLPKMADVLSGAATPWELLPASARALNFRLTVRDNHAGGGGVADDYVTVTATGTQPFTVSAPNGGESWPSGSSQTVTWNVAGSSAYSPNVNIRISTDGGATWTTLAANTPNDGSESVVAPSSASSTCRVMVESSAGTFFDVSNASFSVGGSGPGPVPAAPSSLTATATSSTTIDLTWSDNSSNETGFKIERRLGTRGSYAQVATAGAGATSFHDTGLAKGKTYYYRVRANNASGDSAYSNEAFATTPRR